VTGAPTVGVSTATAGTRAVPELWATIAADPSVPFDPAALSLVLSDQSRWSRRYLYPVVRPLSRLVVTVIRVVKRTTPAGSWAAHATMDRLCVWFLRRFVSPDAGTLLVRHFLVETNLLAFVVRNAGAGTVAEPALRPTTLADLGNRAVIEHDLNVYRVLAGLGRHGLAPDPVALDFSMLTVAPVDPSPGTRRLVNLDIQTALCLMNIPFAWCLTDNQYRQAVHSMRLDASVLALLARLTGDAGFLRWAPAAPVVRVDSGMDVPRAVYEHAVACEYAHERLRQLDRAARTSGGS